MHVRKQHRLCTDLRYDNVYRIMLEIESLKVAILYQAVNSQINDGIIKPKKPGGYADSGADIAFGLSERHIEIITPCPNPNVFNDLDWVFPDTIEGIQNSISLGAEVLWLNTILFKGHPIEKFAESGLLFVGQIPEIAGKYDNKEVTNSLLRLNNIPVPNSEIVSINNLEEISKSHEFPVVVKPVKGRGSEGVLVINDMDFLLKTLKRVLNEKTYGENILIEDYLPGQEITITVMPPGMYTINGEMTYREHYWSLPPIRRFNQKNGIAPYNGSIPVILNSAPLSTNERMSAKIRELCMQCQRAAKLVNAKAAIRIDCRANLKSEYFLFDLNMKPNLTGDSRPHRKGQDSLSLLSAKEINWSYSDMLVNMLRQNWEFGNHTS